MYMQWMHIMWEPLEDWNVLLPQPSSYSPSPTETPAWPQVALHTCAPADLAMVNPR